MDETTIEKTLSVAYSLTNDTTDGKFIYWDKLLEYFKNDDDYYIIKSKMDNITEKLNTLDGDNLKEYLNRDFETDVWFEI